MQPAPPQERDEPFVNEPIDVRGLPRLPDDRFEPLDPAYLRIRWAGDAVTAVIVIAIASVVTLAVPADAGMPRWIPALVAAVILALLGLIAWLQRLEVTRLGYLVRDQDFSFRSGVISRSVVTVPFARIQHVSIDRGPLARAFGLATLQMRTAGSGGLTVPGMTHDTAQRLKALVADRAAAVADDELAENGTTAEPVATAPTASDPAPPDPTTRVVQPPPPATGPVAAPPPPPATAANLPTTGPVAAPPPPAAAPPDPSTLVTPPPPPVGGGADTPPPPGSDPDEPRR